MPIDKTKTDITKGKPARLRVSNRIVVDESFPEGPEALAQCLMTGDITAGGVLCTKLGPAVFETYALSAPHELISLTYDAAKPEPTILALRAQALSHANEYERTESTSHLNEAMVRLAEADEWDWAAYACRWYQFELAYYLDFDEALTHSKQMMDEYPQMAEVDPLVHATLAAALSIRSRDDEADEYWQKALDHRVCAINADTNWKVRFEWARAALMQRGVQFSKALQILQGAHNHFANNRGPGADHWRQQIAMNLAMIHILVGDDLSAVSLLDIDIPIYPEESDYAIYLQAFRALAATHLRRFKLAERSLAAIDDRHMYPGLVIGVIEPARARCAVAVGQVDVLAACESRATLLSLEHAVLPGMSCMKEIEFAECMLETGNMERAEHSLEAALNTAVSEDIPMFELLVLRGQSRLIGRESSLNGEVEFLSAERLRAIGDRVMLLLSDRATMDVAASEPSLIAAILLSAASRTGNAAKYSSVMACADREVLGQAQSTAIAVAKVLGIVDEVAVACRVILRSASSVSSPITIRMLGGFSFESQKGKLSEDHWHGRRKAKMLLARIVAGGGTASAEELVQDMWFGRDYESPPSRRLGPLVYVIRNAFRDLAERSAEDIVNVRRGVYSIDVSSDVICDVPEFSRLAKHCLEHTDPLEIAKEAERALAWYGGDFLSEESPDHWVLHFRNELANTYAAVICHLFSNGIEPSQPRGVISHLESASLAMPTNETICAALVQCYRYVGEASNATKCFHRTRDALRSQLGLSPTSNLSDIHQLAIKESDA